MKKNAWVIAPFAVFFMTLNLSMYSQSDCDCSNVLEKLINKVETEYPGFQDATKDKPGYEDFKKRLLAARTGYTDENCIDILREYLKYFKNLGHLSISRSANLQNAAQEGPQPLVIDFDVEHFTEYAGKSSDGMEGIWTSGVYKVGIVKRQGQYIAFIINSKNDAWKANEIKFELGENGQAQYYMGDHSGGDDTYSVKSHSIIFFNTSKASFVKEFPAPSLSRAQITAEQNEFDGFYVKQISRKTMLLRISSFGYDYTERIRALIDSHKASLIAHDNLIIDVRGNGGGTSMSYRPILPYIDANPVRELGGEYLVTQTLLDALENWVDHDADKMKEADEIEIVKKDIQRMQGKIGSFVPYSSAGAVALSRPAPKYSRPRQVVILADRESGSATEQFLLHAKQSMKVKVFGTPTAGCIDYHTVYRFDLDCRYYDLRMPSVRMLRTTDYPIDNIGIQPDVYMDEYVTDWVQYAQEYLEQ